MFKSLFLIHVFALFVVCTCSGPEEEVKVNFREHFSLKMKRLGSSLHDLFKLGNELCEQRKYTEAILAFNTAFNLWYDRKPLQREEMYQLRGMCFVRMGRMKHAISDFEKAVSLQSEEGKSRRMLANALFDSGNHESAIEHTLRLYHRDVVGLANKFCSMDEFEKAMDVYKKLVIKYPETESFIARGNCHTKMGNMERALSDFQNAVELNKHLPKEQEAGYSRVLLCLALFIHGKMNKEELTSLDDIQFKALASKLLEQERFEDGITCLSAAIEKYPKNLVFHQERAFLHSKKKDYTSAVDDYKICIELDPSNSDRQLDLIEALVDGGDYTEAKQKLEVFKSSMPNDVLERKRDRVQNIRGKLYSKLESARESP